MYRHLGRILRAFLSDLDHRRPRPAPAVVTAGLVAAGLGGFSEVVAGLSGSVGLPVFLVAGVILVPIFITRERDRQHLRQHRETVDRLRLTDPLTGMKNRYAYGLWLSRPAVPAPAMGLVGIDWMSRLNAIHGDRVGDEVIATVAQRLVETMRGGVGAYRLDGDTFALVAEETEPAEFCRRLERVRETMGDQVVQTSTGPVRVTLSIGAAIQGHGQSVQDLARSVRDALRLSKFVGRDLDDPAFETAQASEQGKSRPAALRRTG